MCLTLINAAVIIDHQPARGLPVPCAITHLNQRSVASTPPEGDLAEV
jgi:hypothetical protein